MNTLYLTHRVNTVNSQSEHCWLTAYLKSYSEHRVGCWLSQKECKTTAKLTTATMMDGRKRVLNWTKNSTITWNKKETRSNKTDIFTGCCAGSQCALSSAMFSITFEVFHYIIMSDYLISSVLVLSVIILLNGFSLGWFGSVSWAHFQPYPGN